jgi:hypothetical protein
MKSNSNTLKNAAVTGSNAQAQRKRKPTQKQQILKHLMEGKSITQAEAFDLYNCWRLAPWISRLRQEGYNILTLDEPNVTNSGIHARYILITEPTPPAAA